MWRTGLVAPRHVGSSWTRARTCVPCIGRRSLNHCATREAPITTILKICSSPQTETLYPSSNNYSFPFSPSPWIPLAYFFFFSKFIYLFIFGCVGSSLLLAGFLFAARGGYSLLRCVGFSLWWLLLLWRMGSRHMGFSSCGMQTQ